jgi:hypothetical protein
MPKSSGDKDYHERVDTYEYRQGFQEGKSAAVNFRNKDESAKSSPRSKYWAHGKKPKTNHEFGYADGYQQGVAKKGESLLDGDPKKALKLTQEMKKHTLSSESITSNNPSMAGNTVANQIEMVDELTSTLNSFSEEFQRSVAEYLRSVKQTGDNHNALQEPFNRYMEQQEEIHRLMGQLKQKLDSESLPYLRAWKQNMEQVRDM